VNLAARFVDRMVVMNGGRTEASGTPGEVITRDVLERVFGWPVEVDMWRGIPQFVPLKSGESKPIHQDD
jgi:iron complex transport system ATP-binding protein